MSRFIVFVMTALGLHFVALARLPSIASAAPPNAHQLLQILKAKDAQFDNALLTCVRSGQINAKPFPSWKFPDFAKEQGLEHDEGGPISFRHVQTFLIRGAEITITSDADETSKPITTSRQALVDHHRWSNFEGAETTYIDMDAGGRILNVAPPLHPSSTLGERQRLETEFALGIGYGKRLRQISAVNETEGALSVTGQLELFGASIFDCDLLLDPRSYLVRSATARSPLGQLIDEYVVTTTGSVERGDFNCAREGTLKQTRSESVGPFGDNRSTRDDIRTDVTIEFKDIQLNLDDATYSALAHLEIPPDTQVKDPNGILGYRNPARRTSSHSAYIWILAFGPILALIIIWFLRRRRSHQRM